MKISKLKQTLMYGTFAGALSFTGLALNAQTNAPKAEGGCPHMGNMDMGMMQNCMQMMHDGCPMMDEDVSFTVNETEDGMVVKWVGEDQDSIERIQKMGQHMEKMKDQTDDK